MEEPAYQYVPEVQTISNGADALSQSMLLLEDGLASGAILIQFDQLYRKKPGWFFSLGNLERYTFFLF